MQGCDLRKDSDHLVLKNVPNETMVYLWSGACSRPFYNEQDGLF
jgi:hypothetical protein